MHIVFIVGSYHPNYSAVGRCVGNVADVLGKTHKITVICEKSCSSQIDKEIYNNQKILRVITEDKLKREILQNNKQNAKGISKKFASLRLNLHKFIQAAKIVFSNVSIKKELVDLYVARLLSINEKIDVIIPASMPFESVVAAYRYKKNFDSGVMMIPYLFDQFIENTSLHRLKINMWLKKRKNKKLEKKILINSKSILMMKQLGNYYKTNYNSFLDKFNIVEHPLISKIDSVSNREQDLMNFIYAGSFYKDIRSPEYLLKLFDAILNKVNGVLNLYSFGNCNEIIKSYSKKNSSIKDNGCLPSNLILDLMKKANFLVAVGNSFNNQVPSKIFEYLSTGKPIIYLYVVQDDINIKILSKYSLALCLKQEDKLFDNNCAKIIDFCHRNRTSIMPYEDVVQIYPDAIPEYTADLIEKLVLE